MIRYSGFFMIRLLYIVIDILCVAFSIAFACWIKKSLLTFSLTPHDLFFDYKNPFQFVFVFWLFSVLFFNNIHGLYQTRRELLESIEVWQVIKSVAYASVLTIVAIFILKIENFPRSIFLLAGIFINLSLSIWRVMKRMFVEFLIKRGYNNFKIIIVGAGKIGIALAEEIKKRPELGLKIVGFLDDFKSPERDFSGSRIIGKLTDFAAIARREFVNQVFITIHHDSQVFLQLLEQARDLKIAVRVIPQGFELTTGEFCKYNIGFIPILEYCNEEFTIKQVGKRLFDFVMALFLLTLLSPFFLLISILVKLDGGGAVFYRSKRYGRRGREFMMYKFRSMVMDAEKVLENIRHRNEVDGPIFKIKDDPRVTRFGKILRKFSLDELPQLFNVLTGEMSLVGPRPLPIAQIEKEDLRQLRRLEVRPGITGLWQIRGRSDISFSRLVKWDIWYINNWSFWLDLNILIQTIPVVFRGRGAY